VKFDRSRKLRERSHAAIPGGCHTAAKGDDQYPVLAPGFIRRGLGCHVWDLDGNEYIEYGMGSRSVTLGHAYPKVVEAAHAAMMDGINFTRPSPLEVECAEQLLELVGVGEMVKFTKDGSTATTAAITLARAVTGRDRVALCSDHPFFSYNGWAMGRTPVNAGIPKSETALSVGFAYDDLESLETVFAENPDEIACVILEPARLTDPGEGYLGAVRDICHRYGALFILDEMITGFRWHIGGGQAYFGVEADLSTFGKALANGYAVSALVGKREFMERGGLSHPHDRVFLLSTTHGAETHALAAAMATMKVYQEEPVIEHLWTQGRRLRDGINERSRDLGLLEHVSVVGKPCNLVFGTKGPDGEPSQAFRTLLLQELISGGVLSPSLVISYSHTSEDVDRTIDVFSEAMKTYREALDAGSVEGFLVGPPSKPVYRRKN